MNHYAQAALLTFITSAILTIFVSFKDSKRRLNKIFVQLSFLLAIYGFSFFKLCISITPSESLFWGKATMLASIAFAITYLHLSLVALEKKVSKKHLILIYSIVLIYAAIDFSTNLILRNPRPAHGIPMMNRGGILYLPAVMLFLGFIAYTVYELVKGMKGATPLKRNQFKYFIIAPIAAVIGGSSNFFVAYDIQLYSFNPFLGYLAPFFNISVAYAIIKYRLMDINFVITKSVAYSILLVTSTVVYISLNVIAGRIFAVTLWHYDPMLSHTTIFLLMAGLFIYFVPYIKAMTEKAVEKVLFHNKYLYRDELRNFGRKISFGISQKELMSNTVNFIAKGMQAPYVLIVLRNESYDSYVPEMWAGFSDEEIKALQFEENNALVKWLAENKEVLIREEIALIEDPRRRNDIENELKRIKAYLCIPLCVSANFMGFLSLSERSNGEMYSHVDIGLLHNITNEISLVIAYKQLERHVLQTEKLASLGTLAAGLAHEIRNPLSSIQIFAQLLPQKYNDEEFRNEFGPIIVRDVQRITNLIENVLSLSKTKLPEMASNDINELIEETLSLLNSEIKKNKIQIIKTYAQISPVNGNKEELKQVFLNIILNGIQAMPNGGTLKIESSFVSSLSKEEEKQYYARVKIQDTGGGVEEHTLKKLFDPFFTTKPQGTGLGLALAQRIIDQHKGFIGVTSQPGKGVMFWVDLPISQIG